MNSDCNLTVKVIGVIPAAGRSTRMGSPKQLLPFGQSTILRTVIDNLLGGELDDVWVVTRSDIQRQLDLDGDTRIHVAINDDPAAEMIDSILVAVAAAQARHTLTDDDAILVCPGDMPRIDAELVNRCANAYRAKRGAIVAGKSNEKPGHPIVVPMRLIGELETLRGIGLRGLWNAHGDSVVLIDSPTPQSQLDIDTPEDYRSLDS